MKKITKKQYDAIPKDYKGIWSSDNIHKTNYNGKRTLMVNENGASTLLIEGVSFEIVEDMEKKKQIKDLTKGLIRQSTRAMEDNLKRALNSGCIDFDNWQAANNSMIIPKSIMIALLKEEIDQYSAKGTSFEKEIKKESDNIGLFI